MTCLNNPLKCLQTNAKLTNKATKCPPKNSKKSAFFTKDIQLLKLHPSWWLFFQRLLKLSGKLSNICVWQMLIPPTSLQNEWSIIAVFQDKRVRYLPKVQESLWPSGVTLQFLFRVQNFLVTFPHTSHLNLSEIQLVCRESSKSMVWWAWSKPFLVATKGPPISPPLLTFGLSSISNDNKQLISMSMKNIFLS